MNRRPNAMHTVTVNNGVKMPILGFTSSRG